MIGEVTKAGLLSPAKVTTKAYTPFGEQLGEAASGFGWNGEYYNATTGQVYLRARFYEPEQNRFSQKDLLRGSIADGTSLNRYLYCQNDPVNFADPSGMHVVTNRNVLMADNAARHISKPTPPASLSRNYAKSAMSYANSIQYKDPTAPKQTKGELLNEYYSGAARNEYTPNPKTPKIESPQVEIQNSQKCCTPKESNNLTWENVKNVLNTFGRFTKDVIYPSIEFYAGVGQGIGGSFNVLDVVGLDLEFSANYFDVRLDDGQWSWGQRLHAEASIDIVTFEAGVADISVTDNNGVEQNNLSSKGGFAEIKLPDEISASAYLLFLGGSISIKINYEDLAENIEAFSNNER